ncbi:MAG: hypothetical protein IJ350_02540 [Clostridia bacterium]|nr:hypothetical protein [Clostridia bacterium]
MNKSIADWIDNVLNKHIPGNVVAFCFNLYEEGNGKWSMELVGTDCFDEENEEWACNEATDFGSRNVSYVWEMECEWNEALDYMSNELRQYLSEGKYAELLKSGVGIGVGFVDGNIEILYKK